MRKIFLTLCLGAGIAWACSAATAQEKKPISLKVTIGPDGTVKVVDADTGKEIASKGVIKAQGQGPGQIQIEVQGVNLDKKQLEQLHKELQKLLQDQKPGKQAAGAPPGAGVAPGAAGGVEKKLDLILKQLDELRKDVDGIKKKLDTKHADIRIWQSKPDAPNIQIVPAPPKDPDKANKIKDDVRKRLEDAIKKLEADRPKVTPPSDVRPEDRVRELQRAIEQIREQIEALKKAKSAK